MGSTNEEKVGTKGRVVGPKKVKLAFLVMTPNHLTQTEKFVCLL